MNLNELCDKVIFMSIMASILAGGILLVKAIFRKKMSARLHYSIWFVLIIRLLLPFSVKVPLNIPNFTLEPNQEITSSVTEKTGLQDYITPLIKSDHANIKNPMSSEVSKPQLAVNESVKPAYSYNVVTILWLAGMVVVLPYMLTVNTIQLFKLKKQLVCQDQNIINILELCKSQLNIRRKIIVYFNTRLESPAVYGSFRPKIIIPRDAISKLSAEELKYIFMHELSHIRRKDLIMNVIIAVIHVFHWFNPVIWFSFHKMKQDCEIACDASVLSLLSSDEKKKYGHTIINMFQLLSQTSWIPGTLGFASKYSSRRISMISSFKKTSVIWILIVLLTTLFMGCSSLTAPAATNTKTEKDNSAKTTLQPESTKSNGSDIVQKQVDVKESTGNSDKTVNQDKQTDPELDRMLKSVKDYPSTYPSFVISCEGKNISWLRGDANYTGKPNGKVGNTSFGADNNLADKALNAEDVKPGSVIELQVGDVQGLNKPAYNILLFDKSRKVDQLVSYPSNNNQNTIPGKARITVPNKAGEYLFLCDVNWGNGNNEITYWFKVKVS